MDPSDQVVDLVQVGSPAARERAVQKVLVARDEERINGLKRCALRAQHIESVDAVHLHTKYIYYVA